MVHKLKFLRVQNGMTLEHLADASGLTRSYLSKVERGLSNPSISAALLIAKALGVSVERLFGQDVRQGAIEIVRAQNGTPGDPASYLSMVAGINPVQGMRAFIVRPKQNMASRNTIMSNHAGEEILFVLAGDIEFKIGKRVEILHAGDCVHFDSTIPHRLIAITDKRTEALVVIVETTQIAT
jgi:transcriptional regulator with XRE-family HTH domain